MSRLLIILLITINLLRCQGNSIETSDSEALEQVLKILSENEKSAFEIRKDIRQQLKTLSLKDPARLEIIEKDLRCKETLETIGFTKHQYKRRLKALKAGQDIPQIKPLPHFTCD